MSQNSLDEAYMTEALSLAKEAESQDEVPVGALIVYENKILSRGFNLKESKQNPLKHAEIIAIEKACLHLNTWRLLDCTLYVTLEPCLMCAGALYQSRVSRVVYGCGDPKGGALGSLYQIHKDSRLNHNFPVTTGVHSEPCSQILKNYFRKKRQK